MKHTPGPWKIYSYAGQPMKVMAGNMTICDIRGWGYLTGVGGLKLSDERAIKVQNANARLIAAAPDLLECLKECADDLEVEIRVREGSVLGRIIKRDMKTVERARAAIRAAEGAGE